MVKWFKLSGEQYFGFWILGLVFFALQELPYMIILAVHFVHVWGNLKT